MTRTFPLSGMRAMTAALVPTPSLLNIRRKMGAHSPGANVKYSGNHFVRVSEGDKPYDFLLARAELDITLHGLWQSHE